MPDLDLSFDSPPPPQDLADRARHRARRRRRAGVGSAAALVLAAVAVAVPLLTAGPDPAGEQEFLTPPTTTAQTPGPTGSTSPSAAPVTPTGGTTAPSRAPQSTGTPRTRTPSTGAPAVAPRSSSTVPPSRTTPPTQPSGPASSAPASNRTLTPQVISRLLAAKAALNGLQASDYTGLEAGDRYYAYDPATATYWAASAVLASDASVPAQVSVNGNGGYDLFRERAGGGWTAYDVGSDSSCATPPPAAVATLWGWTPGACRPSVP